MSQNSEILSYLKKGGTLTQGQAARMFGCWRLAARVNDLRDKGFNIETMMLTENDRTFAQYRLKTKKPR